MKRAPHRAVTIRGERQFDGPLMAQRRCDDRHIKQARPAGEKGVSGTLVMKRGGGGGVPFSGGVVVTGSSIYRWVSLPRPTYNSAWLYQKDRPNSVDNG